MVTDWDSNLNWGKFQDPDPNRSTMYWNPQYWFYV